MATAERPWLPRVAAMLREATVTCPLALAMVPTNARDERSRCLVSRELPRWTYAAPPRDARGETLDALSSHLSEKSDALAQLLAARADELAFHTHLAGAVGTPRFSALATTRRIDASKSLPLATAWAASTPRSEPRQSRETSGPGLTLESALRSRLAALRIDWPVLVRPSLAALAATGEGFVAVAADRLIDEETLERTVVHEVDGHVLPRVEALRRGHVLAGIGSAGGIAAQEGWALLCEERAGFLTDGRKRELAWRTIACERMHEGATFQSVSTALEAEALLERDAAYSLAERLFRGSLGARPGFGREASYLAYYIRIRDHLASHPEDETFFRSAVLAPEACALLRRAADEARA